MLAKDEEPNFDIFKDCLSTIVIRKLAPDAGKKTRKKAIKGRKNEIKPVAKVNLDNHDPSLETNDAAELSEFVEYLGEEIFTSLPTSLRTLTYAATQDSPNLLETYSLPLTQTHLETLSATLPPTLLDSLQTYTLLPSSDPTTLPNFLDLILTPYIQATTLAPPTHIPSSSTSRPSGCEICAREHLPLTYHHLIPRQMHEKAVKRGWCRAWEVNKVAWLCRACHSYVHEILSNEELAREWNEVDVLLEREDVRRWAAWVGRVRWKAR